MAKQPNTNGKGDCFKVAAELILNSRLINSQRFFGTPKLAHGKAFGRGGNAKGLRYEHAWVEDDYFAYDYSNGCNAVVPKHRYYELGQITDVVLYTESQARNEVLTHCHYGPWPLKTKPCQIK